MSLVSKAVKKVLDFGASESEACLQIAKTLWIEFDEKIECFKVIESSGIGLRAAVGKKIATYSTSVTDENGLIEAADKAVKIAKVTQEDPEWRHFNMNFGRSSAEGYYDKSVEEIDYGKVVEKIESAVQKIREYNNKVKPVRGLLTINTTKTIIANCYSEEFERIETNAMAVVRAKFDDGQEKSIGSEHLETRFWSKMDLESIAYNAAEKAVKFLRAKPIESCVMPVIIVNDVFASILGTMLSGPITADWVQKGRSPLSGKLGAQVACERLTLVDNGILYGGIRTRPFDDEGHPTQKTHVIREGVLENYLYDTYTSIKDGVESTGNALRAGYWQPPQASPSNLILEAGDMSLEEIVKNTSRGLLVEDVIGEWLSNPVSGNVNATVTHGYLIEDGKLSMPVKGVTVSGDFYKMILEDLESVGNDVRNNGPYYSPTVKFSKMTLAGK